MKSSLVVLLCLLFCVFSTQATNTVTIPNCEQINGHTLDITLQLDGLLVVCPFDIDVNIRLHGDAGIVFAATVLASFDGRLGGEIVHVVVDLEDPILLDADLVVEVTLGNVHIYGNVNLVLNTTAKLLGNLVNGVFSKVVGVVGSLLNAVFNNFDCLIDIINVELLADGHIDVSLQLSKAVQGGISLNLDVLAIDANGISVVVDSKVAVFIGTRDQIVHVILNIAGQIELLADVDVSIEVCIRNIELNANVDISVNVAGLNLCLDAILDLVRLSGGVVGHTVILPDVEVLDCQFINPSTLRLSVKLNVDVLASLSVNAHVELFSELAGDLLDVNVEINLSGRAGEIVTVDIDVSQIDINVDLFVSVELLDLHVNLGLGLIDLQLQPLQLFQGVNGILRRVLHTITGSQVEVGVLNILQVKIENGRILVDLQLDGNVAGGLTVNVNAHLLSLLGVRVAASVANVHFDGVSGEIQTAVLVNLPIVGSLTLHVSLSDLIVADVDLFVDISSVHACKLGSLM